MRTALNTTTLKRLGLAAGLALAALGPTLAFGQDAAAAPPPVPNKGDTAWMLISTAIVLFMAVPGLALFYGGLVRSKTCCRCSCRCS
jgi:Amt family ammonium transporter